MHTVEFAAFNARTHPPCGICIVLAQVAAVGIEVGMLQADQIVVIEINARQGGSPRIWATSSRGKGHRTY